MSLTDSPALFIATEIAVWVMSAVFFVALIPVADLRVLLPLLGLRGLVALALWRRSLAPVRRWQRAREFDEHTVRAADRAFAEFHGRFGVSYALGWSVAPAIALGLGALGIPEPLPIGGAERLAGVMGIVGVGLGTASVCRPFCDAYARSLRLELGQVFIEHRLGRRAEESIGRRLLFFNLALLSAVFLAFFAFIVLSRAEAERELLRLELEARVSEQARALERGASGVEEAGEARALEEVEERALLERIGDRRPPGLEAGQPFSFSDPPAGRVVAAAPLADGRWLLASDEPDLGLAQTAGTIVVFLGLMVAFIGLANGLLNRMITAPIVELDDALRSMAEEGDLQALARTVPMRGDELGNLSTSFNQLLDTLDDLARAASTVASGRLDVEIAGEGDLQDAFRGMLTRLHEMVSGVRSAASAVADSAAEIYATAQAQQHAIEQQSASMRKFSGAVESLARSAEQISGVASEVLEYAEQTRSTTNATAGDIVALGAQTDGIAELLGLISEIAERSDLLALNGALEATRAGDAGRGFGLVAAEMRRLAERVSGTVESVRERVAGIHAAGRRTITSTEHSRKLSDDTTAAARRISEITEAQSRDTEGLNAEVGEVVGVVNTTAASMVQTKAAAENLREEAAELEQLTREFELRADRRRPR